MNARKSWLILKSEKDLTLAQQIFSDTDLNITTEGKRHLGTALGSDTFKKKYAEGKVQAWVQELTNLCEVAKTKAQAACTAYIHAFQHRFIYFMRTIPISRKYFRKIVNENLRFD